MEPSAKAGTTPKDQAPPSSASTGPEKKESTVKRKLKDAVPTCIGIAGGIGKCRASPEEQEAQQREAKEDQLGRRCRADENGVRPADADCTDYYRRAAAHDVEVGDSYLDRKNYRAAESRFREALSYDPANAQAMLHLAQSLEKMDRKADAYEQYQNYLNTDPQGGPDVKRARAALDRLRPYATAGPSAQ